METPSPATSAILDSKGQPIQKGSIVGMADPQGHWSLYQGLVVEPRTDLEGDDYTVAVFFDQEVCGSNFRCRSWLKKGLMDPAEWDKQHRTDRHELLLTTEHWKICPRIVFFQPKELVVEDAWKFEHLVNRVFPEYWQCYTIPFPLLPGSHACWIEGCPGVATDMALVNVWGSIYPLYVCRPCFKKWNGVRSDGPPEHKKPLPGKPAEMAEAA